MQLKDLFLIPLFLLIFYLLAYAFRSKVTTPINKRYFIPALTLKFIGAIALGLVYQFYYSAPGQLGGDTFLYYFHTKIIYESFFDSPLYWYKLLTSYGEYDPLLYKYTSQMFWYHSPTEFLVIKFAAFFSILCFNSYGVIALFFALLSFTGLWANRK